jgi:hypothetical protein
MLQDLVPVYHPKDYEEVPDKFTQIRNISDDLREFNKYSNFEIESLESLQVAENIHQRVNRTI